MVLPITMQMKICSMKMPPIGTAPTLLNIVKRIVQMSKTLGEMILIDPVDIPSKQKLLDAAARLQKDFEILSSYKSKRDNPEAYEDVASFLNYLAEKVKQ